MKQQGKVLRSFVTGFCGRRDSYEVPLALQECGLLAGFVTDFYSHGWNRLLYPLRHRFRAGLPTSKLTSSYRSFLLQKYGTKVGLSLDSAFLRGDIAVGKKVADLSVRTGADLLVYSQYARESFTDPRLADRWRGMYMFHPHRDLIREILKEDRERHPEFKWEIQEYSPPQWYSEREDDEVRHAHFIMAASTFTKRSLLHCGFSGDHMRVVPYGVTQRPANWLPEKPSGQCRFLFVGQGIQRKGLHHLLLAWKELGLSNASLTVVCSKLDSALKPFLSGNIELRSGLSPRDLEQCYAESHVFVMPSLVEGFGLVFLEALTFGCFVIGSENTGLPDLVVPNHLGRSIQAGDVSALKMALREAHEQHFAGGLPHQEVALFARTKTWSEFRSALCENLQDLNATRPTV